MRLIDADKLDWWYKGRPIRRVIDEAPTIDAVPVVRCKDCIYWKKRTVNEKGFIICSASGMEIHTEDFCSYGERKDNA